MARISFSLFEQGRLVFTQIYFRTFSISGWQYFLFGIPIYNAYLAAVVLFVPGTVGFNNYGMDPLDITKKALISDDKSEDSKLDRTLDRLDDWWDKIWKE